MKQEKQKQYIISLTTKKENIIIELDIYIPLAKKNLKNKAKTLLTGIGSVFIFAF